MAPAVADLPVVLDSLARWQEDWLPVQLHPGDLGWAWRAGAESAAAAVRTWCRGGELLAVGLHDGPVLRLAIASHAGQDAELADRLVSYVIDPGGPADVEVRFGDAVEAGLIAAGWTPGESWTPFTWDLGPPVPGPGMDVQVVTAAEAPECVAVHRAAFGSAPGSVEPWHRMVTGPAWSGGTCLLARDAAGTAVAEAVVWSAGPGRPGLIEPMGVHPDHRGHGHGVAVTRAGAAALRAGGSSSVRVATPTALTGAVATYAAAGLTRLDDVRDLRRPAPPTRR
ncbi:GNAT family N-acetyltransferase [Geodermatophilaceae bacterium NBWT11]|nr:GNAT family N-acetyltransferase [Geodermatophilaceae bacterium NBWT11]